MKVINLDEIRPKQYKSNIERYGEDGCIICGRPLSERDIENGKFVHMLPNGDITDSQELGGWQKCAKWVLEEIGDFESMTMNEIVYAVVGKVFEYSKKADKK